MTNNRIDKLISFIFILLCLNSIFYYNLSEVSNLDSITNPHSPDIKDNTNIGEFPDFYNSRIKADVVEGFFKRQAYFSYSSYVSLDADGSGYELVNYDNIPGHDVAAMDESRYVWGNLGAILNTPPGAGIYYLGKDYVGTAYNSIMFTPTFQYETEISGNIHFFVNLHRDFDSNIPNSDDRDVTLKITLWHFNSTSSSSSEIKYVEFLVPRGSEIGEGYTYFVDFDINMTLDSAYTIPVGDRLKLTFEAKFVGVLTFASDEHLTMQIQPGVGSLIWQIVDGDYYSDTYSLTGVNQGILGVQFYMTQKRYPTINLFGATNETVYQTNQNMTVSVTPGSISYYRWDSGTWNSFTDSVLTELPMIHGYRYLQVSASDPVYNSTRINVYKIGYDGSPANLILTNTPDGSSLSGGFILDFAAYDVDSVQYEWDDSGIWTNLTSPYDLPTPLFDGWHNLRVNTTDFYETDSYPFTFFFDSDSPTITLNNAVNGTIYVPGKYLEFEIKDNTGLISLNYSWNGDPNQTWTPTPSNIYSNNLPNDFGWNELEIFVVDGFGHESYKYYTFFADSAIFSIDLLNLVEENYYQGGNTVELIIQRSNTTVYFHWDAKSESLGTLSGTFLTLSGGDGLPTGEGSHTLYIRTFDLINPTVEQTANFTFNVDKTAPIITNLDSYDGGRYKSDISFIIYISDIYSNNQTEIIAEYSLDGMIYQPLSYNFQFTYPFSDTPIPHTLDIRARDLAGNIGNCTISFIIDSTPPTCSVTINGLVDRTSSDGNKYISPSNSFNINLLFETDPSYSVMYDWNNTGWVNITGLSFILSSTFNGKGLLRIRANDSLQNLNLFYSEWLVFDSTPPEITQTFPINNFDINAHSDLEFDVNDYTLDNIYSVTYKWDVTGIFDVANIDPFSDGHFRIELNDSGVVLYEQIAHSNYANLTITAEDFLGNSQIYSFNFIIDTLAPPASLDYFNVTWIALGATNEDNRLQLPGGTLLKYDNSTASDQNTISFQWIINGINYTGEENLLVDPYFSLGTEDGNHTLIFTIGDDTGQGRTPNYNTTIYYFVVDDMNIDYLYPVLLDNQIFKLNYSDTFTFRVNVSDPVDENAIPGLYYNIIQDTKLNLSWSVTVINETIYEVTIYATNVTNGATTDIVIFFHKPTGGGQYITISFRIDKVVGILNAQPIDEPIKYEEFVPVEVYLENDIGQNQTITTIFVNGTEIKSFDFNNETFIASFNISTTSTSPLIHKKGNFSLFIFVDSAFYNGSTSSSSLLEFEVLPLDVLFWITVNKYNITEGTDVSITLHLTYLNGTPITYAPVSLYIYIYNITNTTDTSIRFLFDDADANKTFYLQTNFEGMATKLFNMSSNIAYIQLSGYYAGGETTDSFSFILGESVIMVPLPISEEFPKWLLYTIIGGSIGLAAIISFIIYKLTRPKSFEELLDKVTTEEIALSYSIMSPGVILTIFDQRKGPIPIVGDHSLDIGRYIGRMVIGVDNFLLKIADQAYSSLGFEEHDTGRRVGSIILPTEKMTGFVHGIQIPNKMARGGFENLSLIVLADSEYGSLLLNYQENLYTEIDVLDKALKDKKPLKEIEELVKAIRIKSVQVMIAAQAMEEQQSKD